MQYCCSAILIGKRELVALLSLSSCCLMIVVWLLLPVPWVCLQFVIVVFPDHTHLLFKIHTSICWVEIYISAKKDKHTIKSVYN